MEESTRNRQGMVHAGQRKEVLFHNRHTHPGNHGSTPKIARTAVSGGIRSGVIRNGVKTQPGPPANNCHLTEDWTGSLKEVQEQQERERQYLEKEKERLIKEEEERVRVHRESFRQEKSRNRRYRRD